MAPTLSIAEPSRIVWCRICLYVNMPQMHTLTKNDMATNWDATDPQFESNKALDPHFHISNGQHIELCILKLVSSRILIEDRYKCMCVYHI